MALAVPMPLAACGEKTWAAEAFKKEQVDPKDQRLSTSRGHSGCGEGVDAG